MQHFLLFLMGLLFLPQTCFAIEHMPPPLTPFK